MPRALSFSGWITWSVLEELYREANRSYPCETGGNLLGYWAENRQEVAIQKIVGPGPNAVHRKTSFLPDGEYQADLIARIYHESGRTLTYLGDWHTHPGGSNRLSIRDRKTIRHIGRNSQPPLEDPLMAVLSGAVRWETRLWCAYRVSGLRRIAEVALHTFRP